MTCQTVPFIAICLTAALGGCATPPLPAATDLNYHVIRFNEDGFLVDSATGTRLHHSAEHYKSILDHLRERLADRPHRKILLFVHGGLDAPNDTYARCAEWLQEINHDDPNCYPIFVIWDSGWAATYHEYLFDVRQGRNDQQTRADGRLTFPAYVLSDLLQAVARAPSLWLEQWRSDHQAAAATVQSILDETAARRRAATQPSNSAESADFWMNNPRNIDVLAFYAKLNQRYWHDRHRTGQNEPAEMAVSLGRDDSRPGDWYGRTATYVATIPFKLFTSPIIDAFGSGPWKDMARRAQTVLEGASDFEVRPDTTDEEIARFLDRGTSGGLDSFVEMLSEMPQPPDAKRPYEVTLVGHSMGTIILNELLRRQVDREIQYQLHGLPMRLPVKNVVYMGAACSIRDFSRGVLPFMRRPDHQNVKFYNLSLHPTAENIEAQANDLVPRGSLLCWIDEFLEDPATPLDRTLGRWDNILSAAYIIPPDLRGRVTLKAFALRSSGPGFDTPSPQPQKHSDFTYCPFWNWSFWQAAPPTDPSDPRLQIIDQRRHELTDQFREPEGK
jgi:hypothetical protein